MACVPLGVSRYTTEAAMRAHTAAEAAAVVDLVEGWQHDLPRVPGPPGRVRGRRVLPRSPAVPFPCLETYEDLPQHENGIGHGGRLRGRLLRSHGARSPAVQSGFFQAVDGAPAVGYRAPRAGRAA